MADGIALITLDDARKPMNVVSPEFIDEIHRRHRAGRHRCRDQGRHHHLGEARLHGRRGS